MISNIVKEQKPIQCSTSQYFTGKYWIDGRPIYGQVYEVSTLPNNSSTEYLTSVPKGATILSVIGHTLVTGSTTHEGRPIPSSAVTVGYDYDHPYSNGKAISIKTSTDLSTSTAKLIIEYVV